MSEPSRQQKIEWVRHEFLVASREETPDCPGWIDDFERDQCAGCPYAEVFGEPTACSEFGPFGGDEHKTAACFLAAVLEVEP